MKKAITILAVLIVLVGAVFAVDPEVHSVKIQSTVVQVPPKFQMSYSITTNEANFTAETGTTNNAETPNDWGVQSYVDNNAKTVSDISLYNITGAFTAAVVTDVKLKNTDPQTYTLTWNAGPLTQISDTGTEAAHVVKANSTSSTLVVASTSAASVKGNSVSGLSYNVTSEPGAEETTYGNDLSGTNTVQFGTQNNTAGNLSVFTAVYSADSTAPAGNYEATISLSITCN